jgi:hypothetical protein
MSPTRERSGQHSVSHTDHPADRGLVLQVVAEHPAASGAEHAALPGGRTAAPDGGLLGRAALHPPGTPEAQAHLGVTSEADQVVLGEHSATTPANRPIVGGVDRSGLDRVHHTPTPEGLRNRTSSAQTLTLGTFHVNLPSTNDGGDPGRGVGATEEVSNPSHRKELPMKRTALGAATGLAATVLTFTTMAPAAADPKPNNDSWQISVCDNGQTYAFSVVHHAADPAAMVSHAPALVPDSNVVLQPLAFSGTVSFEVDGVIVESFPVEFTGQRTANPRNTITCASTYTVTAQDGTIVHVQGTDTFALAGR